VIGDQLLLLSVVVVAAERNGTKADVFMLGLEDEKDNGDAGKVAVVGLA